MKRTEYSNEETPVHTQKISVCFVLPIRRQSFVFHKHLKRHLNKTVDGGNGLWPQ